MRQTEGIQRGSEGTGQDKIELNGCAVLEISRKNREKWPRKIRETGAVMPKLNINFMRLVLTLNLIILLVRNIGIRRVCPDAPLRTTARLPAAYLLAKWVPTRSCGARSVGAVASSDAHAHASEINLLLFLLFIWYSPKSP